MKDSPLPADCHLIMAPDVLYPNSAANRDASSPACADCGHARHIAGSTLYCNRSAALHSCADERGLSRLAAIVLKACGPRARFFTPASR